MIPADDMNMPVLTMAKRKYSLATCFPLQQSLRLKTRSMYPCALTHVSFDTEITDEDYLQVRLIVISII